MGISSGKQVPEGYFLVVRLDGGCILMKAHEHEGEVGVGQKPIEARLKVDGIGLRRGAELAARLFEQTQPFVDGFRGGFGNAEPLLQQTCKA